MRVRVVGPFLHLDAPVRRLWLAGKKALRCAGVRQRGTAALPADTSAWVSGKTSQIRAVLSEDAVTMRCRPG